MKFRKSLLLAFVSSSLLLLTTVEARAALRFDRRNAAGDGDVGAASIPGHNEKTNGSGKHPSLGIHRRSNDDPPILEHVAPPSAHAFRKREFGEAEMLVKRDQSNPLEPNPPGYKAPSPIRNRGGGKPPVLKRRGGEPKHWSFKLPPYVEPNPDPGHPNGASDQLRKRDPQAHELHKRREWPTPDLPAECVHYDGNGNCEEVEPSPGHPHAKRSTEADQKRSLERRDKQAVPDVPGTPNGGPPNRSGLSPGHPHAKRSTEADQKRSLERRDKQAVPDVPGTPNGGPPNRSGLSPGHPHAKRSTKAGDGFEHYPSSPYGESNRRQPGHVNDEGIHPASARRSLDHLLERRDYEGFGTPNGGTREPPRLKNHDNDYAKSFGHGKSPAPPQSKIGKRSPLQVSDDEGGSPLGLGGQTSSADVLHRGPQLGYGIPQSEFDRMAHGNGGYGGTRLGHESLGGAGYDAYDIGPADITKPVFIHSLGTFGRIDPVTGELRDQRGVPFTGDQMLFIEENDPVLKVLLEEGGQFDTKTGKPINTRGKPLHGKNLVTFWKNVVSYGAFSQTPNPYPGTPPAGAGPDPTVPDTDPAGLGAGVENDAAVTGVNPGTGKPITVDPISGKLVDEQGKPITGQDLINLERVDPTLYALLKSGSSGAEIGLDPETGDPIGSDGKPLKGENLRSFWKYVLSETSLKADSKKVSDAGASTYPDPARQQSAGTSAGDAHGIDPAREKSAHLDAVTGQIIDAQGKPITGDDLQNLLFDLQQKDPGLSDVFVHGVYEGYQFDLDAGKPIDRTGTVLDTQAAVDFWKAVLPEYMLPKGGDAIAGAGAGAGAGAAAASGTGTGTVSDSDSILGTGGKPGKVKGDSFYSDDGAIYITSSLDALAQSSENPGYFGVCRCARGPNDGELGKKSDTCTAKFIQDANKTAKCLYNAASNVSCTEQGGKPDMTDGDNIWWQQALCKRCVDAGGVSDPKFACPEGYAHDGKAQDIGKLDKNGPKGEELVGGDKKDGTKPATLTSTEDGKGTSAKPAPSATEGEGGDATEGDAKPAPGSGGDKPPPKGQGLV